MSSGKQVSHGDVVWYGKPWIVPATIIRTIAVFIFLTIFVWFEIYSGITYSHLVVLPIFAWTIVAFIVIWLVNLLELLIFRVSHTYVLRQDGLEIRKGIVRLNSFVVTPAGFGDLLVDQSLGARIFGYGDITVNSQVNERIDCCLYVNHSQWLIKCGILWVNL